MTDWTDALEWLEAERSIPAEWAAKVGFRSARAQKGRFQGELLLGMDFTRDQKTVVTKWRVISEKIFFSTPVGSEKPLWNVDCLTAADFQDEPIVITEGEIDAASCMLAGYPRTVSVPDGWEAQEQQTPDFAQARARPFLEPDVLDALTGAGLQGGAQQTVIVAGDADLGGKNLHQFLYALCECGAGAAVVKFCEWPEGCKDPNDVLRLHGAEALRACIDGAKRYRPPGLQIYSALNPPIRPPSTILRPLAPYDKIAAFETGALSVFTGEPGSGKSAFTLFLMDQVRRREGVRIGVLSMEIDPRKTLEQTARLMFGERLPPARMTPQQRADHHAAWIFGEQRFTREGAEEFDWRWLFRVVHEMAAVEQCQIILIDPTNEVEINPPPNKTVTQEYNTALKMLRAYAAELRVHIALVSHPSKPKTSGEAPTGYSIADSAAFFNKAALGVTVARTEDGSTVVRVWKSREVEDYGFDRGSQLQLQFDRGVYRVLLRSSLAV